jgi:hypothetical protein
LRDRPGAQEKWPMKDFRGRRGQKKSPAFARLLAPSGAWSVNSLLHQPL